MDRNKFTVIKMKIKKIIENLNKNNLEAYYLEKKEQAVECVKGLMHDGDTVACGGSQTLFETGVIELLRSDKYHFYDRHAPGLSTEQIMEVHRQAFCCDTYLSGTNAITENGELFNVDGVGNRVAALAFGPKNVIVVSGYNKIVKNLEAAEERVKNIAGPCNCIRLDCSTPCRETGFCRDCSSSGRICSDYMILKHQMIKGRIKVIIIGEELGY